MRYRQQLNSYCRIIATPNQRRSKKDLDVTEKNRIKDICLNCTKANCPGKCRKIDKKELKNELSEV
jgi:hypothetical protein